MQRDDGVVMGSVEVNGHDATSGDANHGADDDGADRVSDHEGYAGAGSARTREWVEGYVRAWASNDPADIGALFTEDAVYLTAPDAEPRHGREAIVAGWVEDADGPGSWSFVWHVLYEASDIAFVQGRTDYPAERDYLNLWVIGFAPDGRAARFTEWYMARPHGEAGLAGLA